MYIRLWAMVDGRTHTLSKVRKRFWITKANSAVRKANEEIQ